MRIAACLIAMGALWGQARVPDFADVKYGPHERNAIDFYRAPSDEPAPVVVFIHGGFVGGSKANLNPAVRDRLLQEGISVAAINYRYATAAPFPAPMRDGVRAVQFLRSKSKEWNIDKTRVAAMGGSAGACMSLWIGYHDDFAKPASADSVERESSRLSAMAVNGAQTVLDMNVIATLISPAAARHPSGPVFFGIRLEEFQTERGREIMRAASPAAYLSRDDPPAWLFYNEPDAEIPADARPGTGIHHPRFGGYLKERCEPLGLTCIVRHASEFTNGNAAAEEQVAFLKKHLSKLR